MSEPRSEDSGNGEFELHKEVEHELARVLRNPREEARRLHEVADEGESPATPLIEIGVVARWVIPLVILMVGLGLVVYYAS